MFSKRKIPYLDVCVGPEVRRDWIVEIVCSTASLNQQKHCNNMDFGLLPHVDSVSNLFLLQPTLVVPAGPKIEGRSPGFFETRGSAHLFFYPLNRPIIHTFQIFFPRQIILHFQRKPGRMAQSKTTTGNPKGIPALATSMVVEPPSGQRLFILRGILLGKTSPPHVPPPTTKGPQPQQQQQQRRHGRGGSERCGCNYREDDDMDDLPSN